MFLIDDLVNLNPAYYGVEIEYGTVPIVLALIPLVYLIPTLYVIAYTFMVYFKNLAGKKDETVNPHVLFAIVLHQLSSLLYMLFDYANFRIPATGLITTWCARQEPSHLLKFIFSGSLYFSYLSMMFPLLIAILRLVAVYYPLKHYQLSRQIVIYTVPLILVYPITCIFHMFPALGVCRQYPPPYTFGSVFIHFVGAWNDIKNYPLLLLNATIWFSLCLSANCILYRKLRKVGAMRKSSRKQRADLTLTLTTASMLFSYLANSVFMILVAVYTPISRYIVLFRPFGNDCDLVIVPWIFFLIHPAFKHKPKFLKKYFMTKIENVSRMSMFAH